MKYFFIFEPKINIQLSSDEFNILDKLIKESRHNHTAKDGGFWYIYSQNRKLSELNSWLSITMPELEQILLPLVKNADTLDPVRTTLHSTLLTISETALAAVRKVNNDSEVREA